MCERRAWSNRTEIGEESESPAGSLSISQTVTDVRQRVTLSARSVWSHVGVKHRSLSYRHPAGVKRLSARPLDYTAASSTDLSCGRAIAYTPSLAYIVRASAFISHFRYISWQREGWKGCSRVGSISKMRGSSVHLEKCWWWFYFDCIFCDFLSVESIDNDYKENTAEIFIHFRPFLQFFSHVCSDAI